MNVFSTAVFLQTLGELHFPKRRRSVEVCEVEGRWLRLLVLDERRPVRDAPYYDFPQPLEALPDGPVRKLEYFPRTVVSTSTVEARVPEAQGFRPSPYIDWSQFADRVAFEQHCERRGASLADSKRQRRRLEKDLGPLSFVFDDPRPEAFDACIRWKGAQYEATKVGNLFADERNVELFRRLRQRGVVVVSSLSAGPSLLSVHLGALTDGRLAWWVPAYDASFSKYSPGRVLMEELMHESQRRGHREFDFLIGDEPYKFTYATHNRVVGPVGRAPWHEVFEARLKRTAKASLARSPRALAFARRLRDRLRARR
jgi:CelD/BcsL family acetyltransferase involved in cellulose biosynthesis